MAAASWAQEPAYFTEEKAHWWRPQGELRLRADRFRSDEYPSEGFDRAGVRLRLGWAWEWSWGRAVLASRHAAGNDPRSLNRARYDQEPSNGNWIETARLDFFTGGDGGFATLRLGLQDNPLLSHQSVWDPDLSLTGASLLASMRHEGLGLQEAGLRAAVGRVRSFPGWDLDLSAGQAVVRWDWEPTAWTLHAGRWELRWTGDLHRFRPVPGGKAGQRQKLTLDTAGAGFVWQTLHPLELRWIRQRNPDTASDGEEFQVFLGGRRRPWIPQVGYVWQRFGPTGTLPPVNGDEWWWIANAKGPRWLLALPLPRGWLLQATTMRHLWLKDGETITRSTVSLTKRF
ncbi:MAG: hypothetical protein HY823_11275 [Acidobacteria bacterium]|nr:hypothetical protein [Acidobacteriota bacterium]